MTEMKKFMSIIRLGHRDSVGVLNEGDYVVAYEKLDGANASFRSDGSEIQAFSRNRRLSVGNTLRGFYDYALRINPLEPIEGTIYYGEWLVKHKVDYGDNAADFYLFDIYDEATGEYAPHDFVVSEAARLGLTLAPILYAGKFRSYEHLKALVGRSALATDVSGGEGIVVKNVNYRDKYGDQVYVKMVSDSFRELSPQKAPRDPAAFNASTEFARTFVNEARVDKELRKLIDEGAVPEDFDITDMGVILKALGSCIIDDIIAEESDSLPADYDLQSISRACGKAVPMILRGIIESEKGRI